MELEEGFKTNNAQAMITNLMDQRIGRLIISNYQTQIEAIPKLDHNLSAIVDKETRVQVATVGTHCSFQSLE